MGKRENLPSLSAHGRKLLLTLAQQPDTWMTAAGLAEAIGVSRRTVLRELPGAEEWLLAAGMSLTRRAGKGLRLEPGDRTLHQLQELLNQTEQEVGMPRDERIAYLVNALFRAEGMVKAYVLAHEMNISERTLKGDLDYLETLFRPYQVTLARRPGLGVWLEGTPDQIRKAVGNYLKSHLPPEELNRMMGGTVPQKGMLCTLLHPQRTEAVLELLRRFDRVEQLHFTDMGFLSLAVHLSLLVEQQRKSQTAEPLGAPGFGSSLGDRLAKEVYETFHMVLSPQEIGYLSDYLAANRPDRERTHWDAADEWNLRYLASRLIERVGALMHLEFSCYPALANDLCCHLRAMLHRASQNSRMENPSLETIQEQYPQLWQATRTACDQLKEAGIFPPLEDGEVGFLAMHFGAILERENLLKRPVRTVVVCPHGMASCKFLLSQLGRDFPALSVQRCCSIRELDLPWLREQQIDLVLSTLPLDINYPSICVTPMLRPQDRAQLTDLIERLQRTGTTSVPPAGESDSWKQLYYAGKLSGEIQEVCETLAIQQIPAPGTRSDLIWAAARLFCPLEQDAVQVEQGIRRRESLSETYIKPLRSVLLHCRTNAVSGCRFGYLSAQPPVYENGKIIQGALILLIPDDGDPVRLRLMQELSAMLIEDDQLIRLLRSQDRAGAVALVAQRFAQRIRQEEDLF